MQQERRTVRGWAALALLFAALWVGLLYSTGEQANAETNSVDAVNGNELLVFKVDRNVTTADRGFPRDDPPKASANGDWYTPINYAQGTFYYRALIRNQPHAQNMKLQFCAWQDRFVLESCGSMNNVSGRAGTLVTWSQGVQDIWKKDNVGVDWSRPRQRYGLAIKNAQGLPVSDYNGWNWNGENPNHWYPLDICFTVVVVAKGSTFSGWGNYPCNGGGGGGGGGETPTPEPTTTPMPEPTKTPTPSDETIYVSSSSGGNVSGVRFADEDILAYDGPSDRWWLIFDGSDVGLLSDVNGFAFLADGSLLLTLNVPTDVAGIGTVDDSDIVRFVPTALGSTTSGSFALYFDGSDVGLEANGEDIDAISVLPDGSLLISTLGNIRDGAFISRDEDLARFIPTSLGENTAGTWELYFDGSAVGLTTADEDLWAAYVDSVTNQLFLATRGEFAINGLTGDGDDILICDATGLGTQTGCDFSAFWRGNLNGFGGERLDGVHIGAGPQVAINVASATEDAAEPFEVNDELDDDVLEDENGEEVLLDQTIFLPILLR